MFNILFGRCQKFEVNPSESAHKVYYLGNVLTGLLKGAYRSDILKQCNMSSSSATNDSQSVSASSAAAISKATYFHVDKSLDSSSSSCAARKLDADRTEDGGGGGDDEMDDQAELDVFNMKMRERNKSNYTDKNIIESVEKSVRLIWQNHVNNNGRGGIKMRLTITQGGLKAITKSHGLTEYYGHRIHYVQAHPLHPKLFVWIYQHVGKSLKSEIRLDNLI